MQSPPPFRENRFLHVVLAAYALAWIAAAINPLDWLVWALENILVVALVGVLAATYRRFAFSNLSYLLIALYLSLHAIGTHTGYAQTPIGFWLKDTLDLSRNPYDRIIHFGFGLLLAYPFHELLVRTSGLHGWVLHLERNHYDRIVHFSFGVMAYPVQEIFVRITKTGGAWTWILPAAIIIAFSGFFEILEAIIAILVNPELGAAYLGLQGDVWDAQKDMALAMVGAAIGVACGYRRARPDLVLQGGR
jgi:putative membrane protein